MVDILGALHKNLNEDEIPDKYKIASLLGSDLDDYAGNSGIFMFNEMIHLICKLIFFYVHSIPLKSR